MTEPLSWTNLRIGLGIDSHRIGPGGPMRIGGIDIPCDLHLIGHSDADVLLHAITDALLGAAGADDIGQLFPDTSEENRGRDSGEILQQVWAAIAEQGFTIVNLDCVIRVQKPKLSPYKSEMRNRIAFLLAISPEQVNLKGKTGEQTGDIGESRLAEAHCTVLLNKRLP